MSLTSPIIVRKFSENIEKARISFPNEEEQPFREFPKSFGEEYPLPQHRDRLLSKTNKHEFDSNIVFHEVPHLYECYGTVASASVSGLIKPYKTEFNANLIISKMLNGKNWPRLKYVLNPVKVDKDTQLDGNIKIIIHNTKTDQPITPAFFRCPTDLF